MLSLETTFPTALDRHSDVTPIEQIFNMNGSEITIITFSKCGVIEAGIVTDGHFSVGCFQRRGYVGNSLKGSVINPIMPISRKVIYDLTLDDSVFSFVWRGRWEMIND